MQRLAAKETNGRFCKWSILKSRACLTFTFSFAVAHSDSEESLCPISLVDGAIFFSFGRRKWASLIHLIGKLGMVADVVRFLSDLCLFGRLFGSFTAVCCAKWSLLTWKSFFVCWMKITKICLDWFFLKSGTPSPKPYSRDTLIVLTQIRDNSGPAVTVGSPAVTYGKDTFLFSLGKHMHTPKLKWQNHKRVPGHKQKCI